MEQLGLTRIHGRESLVLLDSFPTPKAFSLFLSDYAFSHNKNVKRKAKCGNLIKWGCMIREFDSLIVPCLVIVIINEELRSVFLLWGMK
ncbi:hypothetical protein PC116_g11467 [Phytophthora cactorum]|nr:hypothetical protein PC116_g11467 [Phytophthora cactorum]